MKKLFALLLVVCVIASAAIGYDFGARGKLRSAQAAAAPSATAAPAATPEPMKTLDYDALYALHEPDEVVMTVGEHEVTWSEYFYYLYRQATSVEGYFSMMSTYGLPANWTDPADDSGATYIDLTLDSAETTARSLAAMEGFAEELGLELDEEDLKTIAEKEETDIASACGEDATREDFDAYLSGIYLTPALYDRMNRLSVMYQKGYLELYGANGEKLSDEEAMAYLEENGFMSANHILFMTIDPTTGEALDEETAAAKLAQAQEIAAELQGISDPEELLARFAELKTELDEDTGKVAYPDGYVFQPGEMVPEFENAVKSQEAYQVSDPVQSSYGYHVIMTLPLDANSILDYSSSGTPMTARSIVSNTAYSQAVDTYTEEQTLTYAEGFTPPVLTEYLH